MAEIRLIVKLMIFIIAILSIIDVITTLYGFRWGLKELNPITIIFIKRFGNITGIVISEIMKLSLAFLAYIIYRLISNEMEKFEQRKRLCNILNRTIIFSFMVTIFCNLSTIIFNLAILDKI